MSETTTPQTAWETLHDYVRNYDADGQASLFADDGVWELPFAPAGIPRRIQGKEQILAISRMGMERSMRSGRRITAYRDVTMHKTTEPEIIIVEFTLEGQSVGGDVYTIPYIQLIRVRNGRIVLLRDYFPSEVLQAALK